MDFVRLGELCSEIIDCPHSTPEWKSSGVRVIRNFNLSSGILDFSDGSFVDEETYERRTKRAKPRPGDIILSREAPVGAAAMIPSKMKCCLGQRLVLLRADESKISPDRLLFALLSDYAQKQFRRADATGSVVSNLCISDLKEILLPMDKNAESGGIELLKNISAKLSVNLELCGGLERLMSCVFSTWFDRYDFPDSDGRPYRTSGGKMTYNGILRREIPAGWEVRNLLDIVTWNVGSQPPKACHITEARPGYVRFVQNRDYSGGSRIAYIPESRGNKLCNEYDIMLDKYGEAGKTRFGIAGAYSVALGRIDVSRGNMQEYVRGFLSTESVRRYLAGSCMASTRPSLNLGNLSMLSLAIPPAEILAEYERLGKRVIRRILALKKESNELSELQRRLITPIICGRSYMDT